MNKKTDIDLTGVPQTLLLPLIGRAQFSQKSYSPIQDKKAIELVNSINYDFSALLKQVEFTTLFSMIRAYHFDEGIKAFLKKHPKGIIVNLGAGLETAFYRVDNGQLTWIDLDLPEVIELRNKLLPPTEREHAIVKSILDFSWIDDVKAFGEEVYFFAGGLFMYFTEAQVKSIFLEIAEHFPHAELIFDTIHHTGISYANKMMATAKLNNAPLKWGWDERNSPISWSPKIKIISRTPYFYGVKLKFKFPLLLRLKMFFYDFFNKGGIVRVKF